MQTDFSLPAMKARVEARIAQRQAKDEIDTFRRMQEDRHQIRLLLAVMEEADRQARIYYKVDA